MDRHHPTSFEHFILSKPVNNYPQHSPATSMPNQKEKAKEKRECQVCSVTTACLFCGRVPNLSTLQVEVAERPLGGSGVVTIISFVALLCAGIVCCPFSTLLTLASLVVFRHCLHHALPTFLP